MGGLINRALRTVTILVSAALVAAPFFPMAVRASGGLELARDNVTSLEPGTPNVSHDIYFVLPADSQQIRPTDYILMEFTNYTDIVPPVAVVGTFNQPTITLVGKTVRFTDMVVLPGTGLTFVGGNTTNPQSGTNQITVKIAADVNGTIVRNQQVIVPTTGGTFATASAIVQSPLSSISITGDTAPNVFVTLSEGAGILGTAGADNQGFFHFSINGLDPGNHTFGIYSTDALGRTTAQTTITLFLLASNVTTASGILLSSTIQLDQTEINAGDPITVSGTAKPNSQINLFVEAPLRAYTATTDSAGNWAYTIPGTETATYTPGQYQVYTVVQDGGGNQSIVSPTLNFRVKSPDSSNPPPACDIRHGDLNCDTRTNLVDFSILLFHWRTNHRVADINNDGNVNLTDFSIMMFYYAR